uniref:Membrane protein UL56 n=1 Tax=Steinernema glaseri TaxID=37863 RepID=A0A1I8A910_9BILA
MTSYRQVDEECPSYGGLDDPPSYEDVMEDATSPWMRSIRSLDFSEPKERPPKTVVACVIILLISLGCIVFILMAKVFYGVVKR